MLTRLIIIFGIIISAFWGDIKAQSVPDLKIQTQSYSHDRVQDIYTYRNAKIVWKEYSLEGTEIQYNRKKNTLTASGFVRFVDPRIIAVVERIEIDLNTENGVMSNAIVFDSETQAYMTADVVRRVEDMHFIASNCSITTCDPEDPAWEIKSNEIDYYSENFSSAQGATLHVQKIPVFYFPYLIWPTVTRRQSGFLPPQYAYQTSSEAKFNLGFRLELPYFWELGKDHDVTLTMDLIQTRGVGTTIDYQYAFKPGMRGEVKYSRVFEQEPRNPSKESGRLDENEIDPSELSPPRYKSEFNHNQRIDLKTRLILSGQVFSDSQYVREYERKRPNPNYAQSFTTTVNRQFDIGHATLLIHHEKVFEELALLNRSVIETRVQRLPQLSYHLSGTPGDTPFTISTDGTIVRFYRDKGFDGIRNIVTPRLQYRMPLFNYFNFMVGYGKRISIYDVDNPDEEVLHESGDIALEKNSQKRFSYQIDLVEAEVNTSLTRVWLSEEGLFSRMKHIATPRIIFDFLDDVPQDETQPVLLPNPANTLESMDYFDREDALPGRKLLIFRLDNILLVKRRLLERSVKITGRAIARLRRRKLNEVILRRLETIMDQEFVSEASFLEKLEELFGRNITAMQKDLILAYAQRGIVRHPASRTKQPTREGPSWVLSRFNIIQQYNLLRLDPEFIPKGPDIEDAETDPGEPLLPLQLEWSLTPGSQYSVDFFTRYHYQSSRVVESKASFNVEVNPNNQATVSFHNNEDAYRTPYDVFHEQTSTLAFSNTFEANDKLSFGFAGKMNLTASETTFRRRLIEDSLVFSYHPYCYEIQFRFQENVEKIVTSGSKEKEIINRSLLLNISLGRVLSLPPLSQTFKGT